MDIIFMEQPKPITEQEFHKRVHQQLGQEGYNLHRVPAEIVAKHAGLYNDDDPATALRNGDLFFMSTPSSRHKEIHFSSKGWSTMLNTMSCHFLGSSLSHVRYNREDFTSLPFLEFLCFPHRQVLFPSRGIQKLAADFGNVASDQLDRDFINMMHSKGNHVNSTLTGTYKRFNQRLTTVARERGTFILS